MKEAKSKPKQLKKVKGELAPDSQSFVAFITKPTSIAVILLCLSLSIWFTFKPIKIEPTAPLQVQIEERVKRGEILGAADKEFIRKNVYFTNWLYIKVFGTEEQWFSYLYTENSNTDPYFEAELSRLSDKWWKETRDALPKVLTKDWAFRKLVMEDFKIFKKADLKSYCKNNGLDHNHYVKLFERKYYFVYLHVKKNWKPIFFDLPSQNDKVEITQYTMLHILVGHFLKNDKINLIETGKTYIEGDVFNLTIFSQLLTELLCGPLTIPDLKLNSENQIRFYIKRQNKLYFVAFKKVEGISDHFILKTVFNCPDIMAQDKATHTKITTINNLTVYYE